MYNIQISITSPTIHWTLTVHTNDMSSLNMQWNFNCVDVYHTLNYPSATPVIFMFKANMYFNLLWNSNVVNHPNLRECDLIKWLIKMIGTYDTTLAFCSGSALACKDMHTMRNARVIILTFPFSKHRSTWLDPWSGLINLNILICWA